MRWGWKRLLDKGNLKVAPLKGEGKNKKDISFQLAQQILNLQARFAAYLNTCASGKSAKQMRIMLVFFLVVVGGYCLYLICVSLTFLIK